MYARLIGRPYARFLEESVFIRQYLWINRRLVGVGLVALVIVDILEVLPPLYLKNAVDVAVEKKPPVLLLYFAGAYLLTALVQAICRYGWRMYLIRASMLSGRDLRNRLSRHLFGLGASFFDRSRIGNLMSLTTSDVEAVRMEIGPGVLVLADALFYFLTVPVAMFMLSPKLALIAFLPLPFIPWIVIRNEREINKRYEKVQESVANISAVVQEGLAGVRVIKAFGKEDEQVALLRSKGNELMKFSMHLARVQTSFGPTLDFAMSTGMMVLIFVGGYDLIRGSTGVAGAVTLGTFVAFQRYVQKMVWPMAAIGMALTFYQRAVASSDRLKKVLAERSDILEPNPDSKRPSTKMRGKIEFRNLRFRFPGASSSGAKDALSGISLVIQPGERIAFIGGIGSGKSALLSLLPRLYPVERGMLFIDDIDINDWPIAELRRNVGYVSQDVFLFGETVAENVIFGLHDWAAGQSSRRALEEATALASVHEDVMGLEGAYDTRLGERGVNLSGGQKQRITIARALIMQPAVLVLDDALSAVDVHTEENILSGLRSRANRNTEVISAHRISTVRDADKIVVLEHGQVRQMGSHDELIQNQRGAYRKFYQEQRCKEELEGYAEHIGVPQ